MRRMLARLSLVAAVAMTGSMPAAHAAPGGCLATAPAAVQGASTPMKCTWVATGTQGGYFAATPNPWRITISRTTVVRKKKKTVVVQKIEGGYTNPATPPGNQLTFKVGDKVLVEIMNACSPSGQPCGAVGFVGVGNA